MKNLFIISIFVIGAFAYSADETGEQWQGKMLSFGKLMGELLPELYSAKSDPEKIKEGAKKLAELSHSLSDGRMKSKMIPPNDVDPSVAIIAKAFSDDANRAAQAVATGHVSYGKAVLKGLTSYCIACHTRNQNGPDFPFFPLPEKVEGLNKMEKAELYIATRQFENGLSEMQSLLQDKELAKKRPLDWDKPFRTTLAVSIRVKNDPKAVNAAIDSAMKMQQLPEFEKRYLAQLKKAAVKWQKEKKIKVNTEVGLRAEMKRLVEEAKSAQTYVLDRSADVQYLRASAIAHELLRTAKTPKVRAEALFTVGMCNETLSDPVVWPMHESWYKACIQELPHSDLAEECYARLEQSLYFGYAGTDGEGPPPESLAMLTGMRELAKVTATKTKKK